jgi:hypothetical protein
MRSRGSAESYLPLPIQQASGQRMAQGLERPEEVGRPAGGAAPTRTGLAAVGSRPQMLVSVQVWGPMCLRGRTQAIGMASEWDRRLDRPLP